MKTPGESRQDWLDAAVDLMAESGREGIVPVMGASMAPTLRDGQRVVIDFDPSTLRGGDIILYRRRNETGTRREVHRMLSRARSSDGSGSFRTRGDGNPYLDPHLSPGDVHGRVVAVEDGTVWRTLSSRPARLYARCVAWHDLAWSAAWAAARGLDGWLPGPAAPLRRGVGWLDRTLLTLAHGLLFRAVHATTEPPRGAAAAATGADGAG
jgi:signal peptidase I